MSEPVTLLAWLAAAGAGVAGGVYLFGRARTLFRAIEKMAHLMTTELTNNSGTSMKDNVETAAEDIHGIAVAVGLLQRNVDLVQAQVDANAGNLSDVADRIDQLEDERAERRRRDTESDTPATQEEGP